MSKERELFESAMQELSGGQTKNDVNPVTGEYQYGVMQVMWKVWQAAKAQAVPEGCKVVPVNYECVWCGCTELDGWTDEAMLETQHQSNTSDCPDEP